MPATATATQYVIVNQQEFAWTPEQGLDPAAVGALEGFLRREAARAARRFSWLGVDAEDLYPEAVLHCRGAARRYDPARGAGFLAYAAYSVRSAMGVATQSLVRGSKERPRLDVYSYDAPKPGLDEDTAWIDTMAGDAPDAHQAAEDAERQARLRDLLDRLTGRARQVLSLRLGLGLPGGLELRAIASRLGLSRAQVEVSLARAAEVAKGQVATAC